MVPFWSHPFYVHVVQAYNDPGRMVGIAECSENGTQTVYMDKSFLLELLAGKDGGKKAQPNMSVAAPKGG